MDKNVRMVLIIGGIIVGILVIVPLVFGLIGGWQGYGGYGMMGPWMMGGFGLMGLMPVLWIVIVGLIVWAIFTTGRRTGASGDSESALDILKKKYARGEISKEDYEAKKKDLV